MRTFGSVQDAKEFLIQRILEEARREGSSFTDVERKMMYFSEAGWTLADMAKVNEEFERSYNQDQFERKVGKLVYQIRRGFAPHSEDSENWNKALDALGDEDHYLAVLINAAGPVRPRGDFLKLVLTALAIVLALVSVIFFFISR